MAGIDKILEQIDRQAQDAAARIQAEADSQVREIAQQAQDEGREEALKMEEKAAIQCKDILERGKSSAAIVKRKALLQAKQQIIGNIICQAKTALLSLPADEYFTLLLKMIDKYAQKASGQIALCQKDLARMPQFFHDELQSRANGRLTLARQPARIDGGFILLYGDIEENCSFEALFSGAHEQLQDEVQRLLFT